MTIEKNASRCKNNVDRASNNEALDEGWWSRRRQFGLDTFCFSGEFTLRLAVRGHDS